MSSVKWRSFCPGGDELKTLWCNDAICRGGTWLPLVQAMAYSGTITGVFSSSRWNERQWKLKQNIQLSFQHIVLSKITFVKCRPFILQCVPQIHSIFVLFYMDTVSIYRRFYQAWDFDQKDKNSYTSKTIHLYTDRPLIQKPSKVHTYMTMWYPYREIRPSFHM